MFPIVLALTALSMRKIITVMVHQVIAILRNKLQKKYIFLL